MNTIGRILKINIFGESHSEKLGIVIDGCPAGIKFNYDDLQSDLEKRKPSQAGTSPRKEEDIPIICSGIFNNISNGNPIAIYFENKNIIGKDYDTFKTVPRPGHADFTNTQKYKGYNDIRGGGSSSGRMSICLVCAGYFAKQILKGTEIKAEIIQLENIKNPNKSNIEELVKKYTKLQDSFGGIIECKVNNVPVGLGEPFFDSIESAISHMVFSVPGIIAIEFGIGFKGSMLKGSEFNDSIIDKTGKTETNNCGGINGGIANGNQIIFRVAAKAPSSIAKAQMSFDFKNEEASSIEVLGRHDTCFALRLPVIIEAVTAIALADLQLISNSRKIID